MIERSLPPPSHIPSQIWVNAPSLTQHPCQHSSLPCPTLPKTKHAAPGMPRTERASGTTCRLWGRGSLTDCLNISKKLLKHICIYFQNNNASCDHIGLTECLEGLFRTRWDEGMEGCSLSVENEVGDEKSKKVCQIAPCRVSHASIKC